MFFCECFHFIFTLIFVEPEGISSNDDKDIFRSTHSTLLAKQEANNVAISTGISKDCHHNIYYVKRESNFDGEEGMI